MPGPELSVRGGRVVGMEIEGKVAVVTGAGVGVGPAIAERLCAEGASVVLTDLAPPEEPVGERMAFVPGDLTRDEDTGAVSTSRSGIREQHRRWFGWEWIVAV